MKLNQFNVAVTIEAAQLKQTQSGMAILELIGSTTDGKQTIAFTAFKDKATSLSGAMKAGQLWFITGALSGRRYQDKSGGSRVANGCMISEAVMLSDVVQRDAMQVSFTEEDIPF